MHTRSGFCLPATSHLLNPETGASCHGNKLISESHAYLSALKKVGHEPLSLSLRVVGLLWRPKGEPRDFWVIWHHYREIISTFHLCKKGQGNKKVS